MDTEFISVTEAREAIHQLVAQLSLEATSKSAPLALNEVIAIEHAINRILANDILSPIDVPAADNSAMDGYAFQSSQLQNTKQEKIKLKIVGSILAGQTQEFNLSPSDCLKITTGALMPKDCDTVIPQEFVDLQNDKISFSVKAVKPGENRRLRGEDLKANLPALIAGRILRPSDIGLLASLGISSIPVKRKLKVALISSGDELQNLGAPLQKGQIYDSNRYSLQGLLKRLDLELIDCGIVRDNPDSLRKAFIQAAQRADVIISSGGVSVGEADFTKQIMQELGAIDFWKIAMRPGRPMAFGALNAVDGKPWAGKTLFFGLPGNPVAVMVTFYQFVRSALLELNGAKLTRPTLLKVRTAEAIRKKPGRTEFQRGILFKNDQGELRTKTTGSQGAGILRSISEADCFIILHHEQGNIEVNDWVDVEIFDGLL